MPPKPARPAKAKPKGKAKATAKAKADGATPCPRCGAPVPVAGERGACPSCGLAVRFVDVPERPCVACGKRVALPPGKDAVSCPSCGAWQAADPARPLKVVAKCPRCRRDVEVPASAEESACPRCGQAMRLGPAAPA